MNEIASRKKLLILSLSNISMDARVLKQVKLFARSYQVTTCGFGATSVEGVAHIELHPDPSKVRSLLTDVLIRLRLYSCAYWLATTVREAKRKLQLVDFDAILANDLNTVMLAMKVAPAHRIHLDLHEFFPGLEDHRESWVKHRKPYFEWILQRFATRVHSVTTVSEPIAEKYEERFGFVAGTVLNASPKVDADPTGCQAPLRFVYSGVAQAHRRIDLVMRAVAGATQGQKLDLYLTGEGTPAHDELVKLAEELGPRIQVLPAVPHEVLAATLQQYDVGIPVLPLEPTNFALAMPNKLFDYIQARLAIITGPNESMARLVQDHNLGVVSPSYDLPTLVRVIDSLSPDMIMHYKRRSHEVADMFSAQSQNSVWEQAILHIVGGSSPGDL